MSESSGRITMEELLAHRQWVRSLARHLAPDASAAEDLEQETWLRALKQAPSEIRSPQAWLGAVVRNLAHTARRRSGRRERHETAAWSNEHAASPEEIVAEAELQTRLVRAVLELDEPYRATVLYRYFHGLDATAIALRMDVPATTVRTRLKRAIEQLRSGLDVEFRGDRRAWLLLVGGSPASEERRVPNSRRGPKAVPIGGFLTMATAIKSVAAALVVAAFAWSLWPRSMETGGAADGDSTAAHSDSSPERNPMRTSRERPKISEAVAETGAVPTPPHVRAITGTIRDRTGSPVGGARVIVDGWIDPSPEVITESDGSYRLTKLPPNWDQVSLAVHAPGFAYVRGTVKFPVEGSVVSVNATLDHGGPIAGRVIDSQGNPIAGADLRFHPVKELLRAPGDLQAQPFEGAKSAEDGTFSTVGVSGERLIEALPPPPADEWVFTPPERTWLRRAQPGDRNVVVVVPRVPAGVARIVARVVDAETEQPVSVSEVQLASFEPRDPRVRILPFGAMENERGKITLSRVKAGRWRLWVRVGKQSSWFTDVEVGPGQQDLDVRVAVPRGGSLRGRVELAPGADAVLGELGLYLSSVDAESGAPGWGVVASRHYDGRPSEDGSFEYEGLMPGRYRVSVRGRDLYGESVVDVRAGDESTNVVACGRAGHLQLVTPELLRDDIVRFEWVAPGVLSRYSLLPRDNAGKWYSAGTITIVPGTYKWTATFYSYGDPESQPPSSRCVEGEFTVGEDRTVQVSVAGAGK